MDGWEAWWDQAQDVWHTFDILSGTTQHAAACFFAQQAGEKAAKAVLTRRHGRVWGHSVMHLLRDAGAGAPLDAGKTLDFFYVPTRYPDVFPEGSASEHFAPSDVARARAAAKEVLEWAAGLLMPPGPGPTP